MAQKHIPIPIGTVFTRLIVISQDTQFTSSGEYMYLCQCSCGSNPKYYTQYKLRSGHTRSCGCIRKEETTKRNKQRNNK